MYSTYLLIFFYIHDMYCTFFAFIYNKNCTYISSHLNIKFKLKCFFFFF